MTKSYPIPADVFEGIFNYLANRPYAEVGQVMPLLAQIQPVETPDPKD
jgi:hypothetical protein